MNVFITSSPYLDGADRAILNPENHFLENLRQALPPLPRALFVACGSVNPVTLRQMKTAEDNGFAHIHLKPVQKLETAWLESPDCEAHIRQ